MTAGSRLSIREYRALLIEEMPPWMELGDLDLFNYFSLSGFTWFETMDAIVVDGTEYKRDEWTLGELKTDLGIASTGNYDGCLIDLIEEIDENDDVWIYTNPNFVQIDAMATILKKCNDRREQLLTESNPMLATTDGLLSFWENIFQSERMVINGELESDSDYMLRAISELFGQSSSVIKIRQLLEKYGLTNFYLEDSRKDPFKWNLKAESDSVNLHLEGKDFDRIPFLRQVFFNIALAGKRLFVLCPAEGHDCFCINYGNATDGTGYIFPKPYVPGYGTLLSGYGGKYGEQYGD